LTNECPEKSANKHPAMERTSPQERSSVAWMPKDRIAAAADDDGDDDDDDDDDDDVKV